MCRHVTDQFTHDSGYNKGWHCDREQGAGSRRGGLEVQEGPLIRLLSQKLEEPKFTGAEPATREGSMHEA